jgi:hypothetical protein
MDLANMRLNGVTSLVCSARSATTKPPALLFKPFHHAADLRRLPYSAAGRGWNAALVERHRDAVPRRYPAAPQLRDDGSQLRCSRVRTRNEGFAPGVAGLGLPSHFHGFQGKGKTRAKGVELKG